MSARRPRSWFGRLLELFPLEFRAKHGEEMEQLFRDQLRDARSRTARRRVWARTLVDIVRTAPFEHVRIASRDAKHAVRGMRSSAGTTAVVLLTLTLGIGANVALFGVVNSVFLRPLPFERGDELVRVYATRDGGPPFLSPSNPVLYDHIRESGRFFESIVAQRLSNVSLDTEVGPERLGAMAVTADWAHVMGVTLTHGRSFDDEEEAQGLACDVVLVSYAFWTERLGGDVNAVGTTTVRLDGRPRTVIGVLPPGFQYPYENQIWVPMNLERDRDGLWGLNIQARLKETVSISEARAELVATSARIQREDPRLLNGMTLTVRRTREVLLGDERGFVLVLLGAVGFLLLLVAVNIGNLFLARAAARQSEMALRTALGASRLRQMRQILTESITLSLVGGAGGLLLALWLLRFTGPLIPGRMSNLIGSVSADMNVLWFTIGVSVVTGVLFGLAPAVRSTGAQLADVLKRGKTKGGRQRLAAALVVSELALALVILIAAGTLSRHYQKLYRAELGYEASAITLASVPLDDGAYADESARRTEFILEAEERLRGLPGVRAVGTAALFPSIRGNRVTEIAVEGREVNRERPVMLNHRLVTSGFFRALELPALRGRLFDETDRGDAPHVAVISEKAAARFFAGEDPIGRRVRNVRAREEGEWITIIGIVGDVREFLDVEETWYLPYAQHASYRSSGQAVFTLRTDRRLEAPQSAIRAVVDEVDPSRPVFDVESIQDLYWESLAEQRLGATIGSAFAGFGLLMAALGIGGVMASSVGQRVHELGLRIALGARPRELLLTTLARGARWTALGVTLGIVGSLFVTRALRGLVPDVEALGALHVSLVALVLAVVALAACYLPARRAVRVDPLTALRED